MRRQYLSAPLPFQGQKRMFAKEFIKVLKHYPDDAVFVDLFGGSGLLSHITKCQKPDATVVYNDFDNYRRRLENIPRTNALLDKIREVVASVPRQKVLPEKTKEAILFLIEQEEKEHGYVDYITLSTSLLFSRSMPLIWTDCEKKHFTIPCVNVTMIFALTFWMGWRSFHAITGNCSEGTRMSRMSCS